MLTVHIAQLESPNLSIPFAKSLTSVVLGVCVVLVCLVVVVVRVSVRLCACGVCDATGVRPVSQHLRMIPDFCSFRGALVLGGNQVSSIFDNNLVTGQVTYSVHCRQ